MWEEPKLEPTQRVPRKTALDKRTASPTAFLLVGNASGCFWLGSELLSRNGNGGLPSHSRPRRSFLLTYFNNCMSCRDSDSSWKARRCLCWNCHGNPVSLTWICFCFVTSPADSVPSEVKADLRSVSCQRFGLWAARFVIGRKEKRWSGAAIVRFTFADFSPPAAEQHPKCIYLSERCSLRWFGVEMNRISADGVNSTRGNDWFTAPISTVTTPRSIWDPTFSCSF